MTAIVAPTVTADNPHTFRAQMERIAGFALRVHIDLSDGSLAPNTLLGLDHVWWPGGMKADLHIMSRHPFEAIEQYQKLEPQLVIIHAEAKGDFAAFADAMHASGIKTGVALLQETTVESIAAGLPLIDHVMLFSGSLGQFGGKVDLGLLKKAADLKRLKPEIEIGWDGGINDANAHALVEGGIDVLNVGGFIQRSANPEEAFETLELAAVYE